MNKIFTLLCSLIFVVSVVEGQVYVDEFDNNDPAYLGGSGTYTFAEADGELTVTAANTGPWDVFTYQFHDPSSGDAVTVDATGNNKVYVRAKASNVGVELRLDLEDGDGFVTSQAGLKKILTTEYQILEFDFTDLFIDGGYGGTACETGPCAVDGTNLSQIVFFTNPGIGGFSGSVVIDYIAFGEEPTGIIMSEVFQDHFDVDSSLTSFTGVATYGLSLNEESELIIAGDGTNPMWDPLTYIIRNPSTYDPIDIDVTGNHKMYVKIKSTVPNTTIRFDLIDIDGFANTQGSITKLVGTDYSVIEFDFAGTYVDLGFGGTPCTPETAPCPVDGSRVSQLNFFIEPGVGEFLGELTIDYISFDIPLEPAGPAAELIYADHFDNETLDFTAGTTGFTTTETGTELIITGDGSAGAFAAVSYILHDKDLDEEIVLNMEPAQNKVYVRARAESGTVPLRIDLADSTGLISNDASLTKIIGDSYETFEYNFTGAYFDGGFGGTPCETGPCPLDPTAITQVLIYVDPVAGGYNGNIYIDFISMGQPAPEVNDPVGVNNYADQMDDATAPFVSDATGLVSTFADDEWTITGDGSSDMWTPLNYGVHNEAGEAILANAVGSMNKLYVKAKTSVAGTELRVDLQDRDGFVTNAAASAIALSEEYQIIEIDFSANYNDGGFGGSPCTSETAPCPVDGERVANLQFFINPGVGAFSGTVTIDWISFGQEISEEAAGVINYADQFSENTILFVSDSDGYTSTTNDVWTITADGTAAAYAPISYNVHDASGELILADAVGSNDVLYIRARATEEVNLRVDLQDNLDFVTNANARSVNLSTDYQVYEINYAGSYNDGGFGGTPCDNGPCPVDGQRIANLQLFANADDGGYAGTIEIDWIAFGEPLIVGVVEQNYLQELRAYPNPVHQQWNVVMQSKATGTGELTIANTFGQVVEQIPLGSISQGENQFGVDVTQLPAGMYTAIFTIDGVYTGYLKFIK